MTGPIIDSSTARHEVFNGMNNPETKEDAVNMLGDQSGKVHTVFRENGGDEFVKTIAVGRKIFTNLSRIALTNIIYLYFKEFSTVKSKHGVFILTIQNSMNHLLFYHLY